MTALMSGVVGGGCGLVLGAVLVPFGSALQTEEFNNLPMRQQVKRGFQEVGSSSRSWGKNLMVIGAVFSCTECFVEKSRGRTDRWNPVFGGCITGGVLAVRAAPTRETARPSPHASAPPRVPVPDRRVLPCLAPDAQAGSGPQAMAIGCAGFAAFSYVIDQLGFGQFE